MDHSLPSVTIIHGGEVRQEPVSPDGIIQAPYATGTAILAETPVAITSKDAEEGARRGLPVHEAVFARMKTVGPNGGEVWHTHMTYYDIFFYILSGKPPCGGRRTAGGTRPTSAPGTSFICAPVPGTSG